MFDIKNILNVYYGIDSVNISPQKGGWSALAYKVAGSDADYFLKVYDKKRASTAKWTALIDDYAPIVQWLNDHTQLRGSLPVPVLTKSGAYKCEDDHGIYLLYEYIDGETIGDRPLHSGDIRKLAEITAELHTYGEGIPVKTDRIKESFAVPFLRQMREWLGGALPGNTTELFDPYVDSVYHMMEKAEELSDQLKSGSLRLALCHTDIHNWNLMTSGREFILIDWEGLKLAPVEADLMFFADQPYFHEFMTIYWQVHKGFQLDQQALRFYQLRRRLEDVWEFAEQLVFDCQTEQERAETVTAIEKELKGIKATKFD
ncbi:aminoglycoside phosphotransferase family protein [Bacillus sonorensis]|uniref:aminoglycoside phosphotransferase family protein n=1 Tax=Bacillus sonorensis TaxID=119858 RepID=UPI001F3C44CF|nr:aminoglycoside phosphotransferase family protein [Bacillus sonorensis]MCF7620081.1 aminoglycoside phosphotransferase family protein [Bacillus sonorensis]